MTPLPKLIAVLGPTASGKSAIGIELAKLFNGEIISCDSRQVYTGLDIGSGKVTKDEQQEAVHHMLDVVDVGADFSVVEFKKQASAIIADSITRKKLPILVGGSALYAYAVIDNYEFSDIPANTELRKELAKKTVAELQEILSKTPPSQGRGLGGGAQLAKSTQSKDITYRTPHPPPSPRLRRTGNLLPRREGAFTHSDWHNPRRLIRAIEKLHAGENIKQTKNAPLYNALILATDIDRETLYKKIDARVDERLAQGMIEEVETLRKSVSDECLLSLGLEYKWITEYLQGSQEKEEMITRLKGAIHEFARKQLTWLKRDARVVWVKNVDEAKKAVHCHLEHQSDLFK